MTPSALVRSERSASRPPTWSSSGLGDFAIGLGPMETTLPPPVAICMAIRSRSMVFPEPVEPVTQLNGAVSSSTASEGFQYTGLVSSSPRPRMTGETRGSSPTAETSARPAAETLMDGQSLTFGFSSDS